MPLPFLKLLLLITCLLLLSPAHSQSSSRTPSFQFQGTIPSSTDPLPLIPMSPGLTKKLIITLTGRIDSITMTFQEDAYEPDSFKLFIKNNNQMETTQTATFQSPENLNLTLDANRNLLVLQGDQRFRISKFVREREYDVQVRGYQRNSTSSDSDDDAAATTEENSKSSAQRTTTYFILAGIVGGLLGLVVLIKVGSVLVRRIKQRLRKSSSVFSVHSRLSNKGKEGDLEAGGVTPVLAAFEENGPGYHREHKCSLTIDERGAGENEMEFVQQHFQKKEFPSSLTSIESGMAKSTTASTTSLISSYGSLQNIAAKKGPLQLAAITEESSYVKPTLPLGPLKIPPLKLEELTSKSKSNYNRKLTNSKIMPSKPVAKSLQAIQETNADNRVSKAPKQNGGKQGNKTMQKKVVTMSDIRDLVDKVMKEKKKEKSIEISEDSSKDEEAEPIDYFSCMVCCKEKRSAVAEPCGHVFACANCTKRVMGSSKGCCALCSKKIKGYHPLKN